MKNSKVIDLLKCLKTNEIADFKKMLISPFFTRKEVVKTLFDYLIKFHPKFDDEKKLDKAIVYKKVFQKNTPNDESLIIKALKNPSYDLKNLLEEFFIYQELSKKSIQKSYLLYKRYSDNNMETYVMKELAQIEKELSKLPIGEESLYQLYQLNKEKYTWREKFKHSGQKLDELLLSLDNLKSLQFLKFGLEAITKNQLFNDHSKSFQLEEYIEIAEKNKDAESMIIRIYARLFLLYTSNQEEDDFDALSQLVFNTKELIKNEKKNMAIFLINYANKKMQEGNSLYVKKFF